MKKQGAISVAILLSFLIGAPLISYYYLKMGYKFRKEALVQLEPKGEIKPFKLQVDTTSRLDKDTLESKVSLISFVEGSKEDWAYLTALYHQYKSRKELQLLTFAPKIEIPDSIANLKGWKKITLSDSAYRVFAQQSFPMQPEFDYHHMLIDTAQQVRKIYNAQDGEAKTQLIEHMAIVLPRTKDSDVVYEVPSEEK